MKLISLFDGSGGFPLAGIICGIEPIAASEVEPYPIAVTRSRFPSMKHLGDVSKVSGAVIEPADIITFGSPCQDLSVAGKRAGLGGERSGLFMEAIRIIKEMRNATGNRYPAYAIWENVPGAFSSNKGEDFRVVLEEFVRICEPTAEMPPVGKGGWPYADIIMGDGWSIAYRTFDAQYWGVPQRRRRIYLVADFRGERAGKILFESEGVSGYSAESFRTWQRAAGRTETGAYKTGTICLNDQGGQRMDVTEDVTCTLRAEAHHPPLVFENHSQDSRYTGPLDVAQTILSAFGTGGNNQPFVVETPKTLKIRSGCEGGGKGALIQDDKSATLGTHNDQTLFQPRAYGICSKDSNAMKSANPHSGFYEADTSRTLDGNGGNPSCNQGGMAVVALEGNGTRPSNRGSGYSEDNVSFTLNATEQHAVAVEHYCASKNSFFMDAQKEHANTLVATDYKDPPLINDRDGADYIVRRLTPTECARLQGFPDGWAEIDPKEDFTDEECDFWREVRQTFDEINGRQKKDYTKAQLLRWYNGLHTDSAEYKMWGNGIALPTALYVMEGIAEALAKEE